MTNTFRATSFLVLAALGLYTGQSSNAFGQAVTRQMFGSFSGDPLVQLLPDGQHVRLQENFSFTDDKKRTWLVPSGYVSDGASIPQPFWSIIGSPLDGPYRNAAIVHDYFCEQRGYDWQEVHQTFYKGMRANGVGARRSWIMYKAVYYFGPRWEKRIEIPKQCQPGPGFSPDDCVINAEPKLFSYSNPLNKQTFLQFLDDLRREGYVEEANQIERDVRVD